ncbi:MAG: HEAT repeat domain-containing protein [Chlamydiia bacterium]|nr:HEAT repeat domain-containing protein [Chlamydiia bacterium]
MTDQINALKSGEIQKQREIVTALIQNPSDKGTGVLIWFMESDYAKPFLKRQILTELGKRKGNEAYQAAVKVLKNPNERPEVRGSAANALGAMKNAQALGVFKEILNPELNLNIQMQIVQALGNFSSAEAEKMLLQFLSTNTQPMLKIVAIQGLAKTNSQVIESQFQELLQKEEATSVQRALIRALGQMRVAEVAPQLAEMLTESSDAQLKQDALLALAQMKNPKVVPQLIPLLKDSGQNIPFYTIYALGEIVSPEAIEPLIEFWDEQEEVSGENVRQMMHQNQMKALIINSLRNIYPSKALAVFMEAAKPVAPAVASPQAEQAMNQLRITALDALAETHDLGVGAYIRKEGFLNESNAHIRAAALKAMGASGDAEGIEQIVAQLSDSSPLVRWSAVQALGQLKMNSTLPTLIKALDDPHPEVVIQAIYSLAPFHDPTADNAIREVADTSNFPHVKEIAQRTLRN